MTASRAALLRAVQLAREAATRRAATPMAYAELWDQPEPRTSQRRALRQIADPAAMMLLLLGGNRTGKSEVAAQYAVACAGGRDAVSMDRQRRVPWVERWLAVNGLPASMIPTGAGRVWVASPSFAAAVEQIRPKLLRWCPQGTTSTGWFNKGGEGELRLPGGGVIVSKAYRQYDQDPQTWEGANVRAIVCDEQPNSYENLSAAFSRLVDQRGKLLMALTPLRGRADWLYRELVRPSPEWLRLATLHGSDNPHVPQDWREMMLSAVPAWQRASRDVGAFGQPEGQIYPFDRGVHVVEPFDIPAHWLRWQGIDWGARAPHVIWAAESPDGTLYVYREIAPRRTTTEPGISDRRLIQMAREAETEAADLWLRVADSESPGAIEEAASQGLPLIGAEKGPGSVVAGINLVEALMLTVDPLSMEPQPPRIRIFRGAAPVLESEMESYQWARNTIEPRPDPTCPDHGLDALRYIVQLRQSMGMA